MQSELARYGSYTVVSYTAHEVASFIPVVCTAVTVVWLLYLVYLIIKKRNDPSDKIFVAVLLALLLFQGGYIQQKNTERYATAEAEIESVDATQGQIVIRNKNTGEKVTLESPNLVNYVVDTDEKYLVSYTWHVEKADEGKLDMIQKIE